MNSWYRAPILGRVALLASITLLAACARIERGPYYSSTAEAIMPTDTPQTEAHAQAVAVAESKARDHIMLQALDRTLPDGRTLGDAVIEDPFIRAKVWDIVRTAKMTDQTIKRDLGIVSVTIELDESMLDRLTDGL